MGGDPLVGYGPYHHESSKSWGSSEPSKLHRWWWYIWCLPYVWRLDECWVVIRGIASPLIMDPTFSLVHLALFFSIKQFNNYSILHPHFATSKCTSHYLSFNNNHRKWFCSSTDWYSYYFWQKHLRLKIPLSPTIEL